MEEFKNETSVDLTNNIKATRRLKIACEKAKKKFIFSTTNNN